MVPNENAGAKRHANLWSVFDPRVLSCAVWARGPMVHVMGVHTNRESLLLPPRESTVNIRRPPQADILQRSSCKAARVPLL
jgi:hypothetical protein